MKKAIILFGSLFVCISGTAQIVNIPDPNFKNALVNTPCVDTNGDGFGDSDADANDDGEIQLAEALAVLRLHVNNKDIDDLNGIDSFSNIIELHFASNNLTGFDITQNQQLEILNCGYNPLISIDVTQNPNLIELNCYNTQITELDISQNTELEDVLLRYNLLTSLDISQNPKLIEVNCLGNQISNLDTSQNAELELLICDFNQITDLNLSQNIKLTRLNGTNNQLTSLNLENGFNEIIFKMLVTENPNLTCIQVDDEDYANSQVCNGPNNPGWCKDPTAVYSEDCTLGIAENKTIQFVLYPNPALNILEIALGEHLVDSILLFDTRGSLIKKMNTPTSPVSLDISNLSPGLYFVTIYSQEKVITKKFIKY